MKKFIFSLFVLVLVSGCSAQDATQKLDSLLAAYTRVNKFNGSVLVARKGAILLDKGYGFRDAAAKIPNDSHSIYQIGSVTKQFTTAIILKLQAQGKLNVKDKLSKYFPDYPKGDSISLEQMMTHTSGIYSYTDNGEFMKNGASKPATREEMMALFKDKPLNFSPGTGWNYSNSAYSLLGYIIEMITKKSYEQNVRENIFQPLQMHHSGFDFTHLAAREKAIGYFVLTDENVLVAPIVDSTVAFSAGAIYSTTGDLYRWHQGLERNIVLTSEQQERAYKPLKNKYGYGWVIDSIQGKRVVSHSGGIYGFTSSFSRVPEDDVCIVLLSNSASPALGEITNSIYAILYNKPYQLPKERTAIVLTEEKLKEYVGEYEITPQLHLQISINEGGLIAAPTGQPTVRLNAEKEDYFFVKQPDVQLQFTRNDAKQIDGFILYQGGQQVKCKKVN